MRSIIFSLLFLSVTKVAALDYILTPKYPSFTRFMPLDFVELADDYNLESIAEFEDFTVYKTSEENMERHRNTFEFLFHVEEDQIITLDKMYLDFHSYKSSSAEWHLDRITKHKLPLDGNFPYSEPGMCHRNKDVLINTYVVDTGIDITHPQFEGRASWGANFVDDIDTDCNGHSTHVAGIIGGKDYGVCVDANLIAVKVLDCQGSGSLSGVIKGIEWVFNQHKMTTRMSSKVVKSIINMSLGGGYSYAINRAVEACLEKDQNFYIVVAAGNENSDSCSTSPASAPSVLTVMASDARDNRAYFSNFGKCSDIYAPGVDILSSIPNGGTARYSGTSMGAPQISGALNHFIDMYPEQNMKQIKKTISKQATKGVIHGDKPSTKNLLVYLHRN